MNSIVLRHTQVALRQQAGMATNAKVLRLRLKTVSNIKRITSTMKMVAASKLRGFQTRMEAARPLAFAVNRTFENLPAADPTNAAAAAADAPAAASSSVNPLIIAVSSDRGLCGAINSTVVKSVRRLSNENGGKANLITIGDKSRTALARTHSHFIKFSVNDVFKKPPTFLSASLLAEEILSVESSKCFLVYNKFKSAIAYDTVELPLTSANEQMAALPLVGQSYEFEGDDSKIMADLIQFRFAVGLFSALLENATCEQSARMAAMDGASKNCGEMISKLTTQMNRARQASITTELCEIVAGAEALAN